MGRRLLDRDYDRDRDRDYDYDLDRDLYLPDPATPGLTPYFL
jgi:hypothetical protein